MRISVLVTAVAELAVIAMFLLAGVHREQVASRTSASFFRVEDLVWRGAMPDGALHPQFARISGGDGFDFVVGHDVPRVSGGDPRGRLRVYPIAGAGQGTSYKEPFWLDERMPSARIPSG